MGVFVVSRVLEFRVFGFRVWVFWGFQGFRIFRVLGFRVWFFCWVSRVWDFSGFRV